MVRIADSSKASSSSSPPLPPFTFNVNTTSTTTTTTTTSSPDILSQLHAVSPDLFQDAVLVFGDVAPWITSTFVDDLLSGRKPRVQPQTTVPLTIDGRHALRLQLPRAPGGAVHMVALASGKVHVTAQHYFREFRYLQRCPEHNPTDTLFLCIDYPHARFLAIPDLLALGPASRTRIVRRILEQHRSNIAPLLMTSHAASKLVVAGPPKLGMLDRDTFLSRCRDPETKAEELAAALDGPELDPPLTSAPYIGTAEVQQQVRQKASACAVPRVANMAPYFWNTYENMLALYIDLKERLVAHSETFGEEWTGFLEAVVLLSVEGVMPQVQCAAVLRVLGVILGLPGVTAHAVKIAKPEDLPYLIFDFTTPELLQAIFRETGWTDMQDSNGGVSAKNAKGLVASKERLEHLASALNQQGNTVHNLLQNRELRSMLKPWIRIFHRSLPVSMAHDVSEFVTAVTRLHGLWLLYECLLITSSASPSVLKRNDSSRSQIGKEIAGLQDGNADDAIVNGDGMDVDMEAADGPQEGDDVQEAEDEEDVPMIELPFSLTDDGGRVFVCEVRNEKPSVEMYVNWESFYTVNTRSRDLPYTYLAPSSATGGSRSIKSMDEASIILLTTHIEECSDPASTNANTGSKQGRKEGEGDYLKLHHCILCTPYVSPEHPHPFVDLTSHSTVPDVRVSELQLHMVQSVAQSVPRALLRVQMWLRIGAIVLRKSDVGGAFKACVNAVSPCRLPRLRHVLVELVARMHAMDIAEREAFLLRLAKHEFTVQPPPSPSDDPSSLQPQPQPSLQEEGEEEEEEEEEEAEQE